MSATFASFEIPNYRRYFTGLLVANVGAWMSSTAKQWLVLTILTHNDATALGYMTSMIFLPALIFAPVAGLLADRFPKRTIILCSQVLTGMTALLLTILTVTGAIELWMVFALAFVDGTASAIMGPAQQAFVSEIVPRERLTNAISLNSAQFNGARLLGPGLGGALIALFAHYVPEVTATGIVMGLNVVCFLVLVASIIMLDMSLTTPAPLQRGKGQLREGLRYVGSRPDVILLMVIAFAMGNLGFNFAISNAVMATTVFGKGAGEFGALGSIMGIGALAAALMSARRTRPRLRHIFVALAMFTVFSAVSALSPTYEVFALTLIPIGLCAITVMVTANSLVQMNVADVYRGRVMTLWSAVLLGGTPFISPLVGWIGQTYGARATVWFEGISVGITAVVCAVWLMRHDKIRVRLDRRGRAPWLVLDRGQVTEDVLDRPMAS